MSAKIAVLCIELNTVYNSLAEAAEAFGAKDACNISNCIKGRINTAYGYHWKALNPKTLENQKKKNKEGALCWSCFRATHFITHPCPWASKFEAVEGWTAEETTLKFAANQNCNTYRVTECPLFMPDD